MYIMRFYHLCLFKCMWGGRVLLYMELEHKMGSELLLFLHQYFSISLSSNNVSSDQMKIYIIPKRDA